MILLLTLLMFLEDGARSQVRTGSRAYTLTQQRVGFALLTGELRQAETFHMVPSTATTSPVVEFDTYVRNGAGYSRLRRVRYDCSAASRCTRAEDSPGTNIPAGTTGRQPHHSHPSPGRRGPAQRAGGVCPIPTPTAAAVNRLSRHARERLRDQTGATLPELMVVVVMVTVGLIAIVGILDQATRTATAAQRHQQAVQIGQREI